VGKLLGEFRRASNEFKFQIQEEIRNMEEEERRKKLAEARAQTAAATPAEPAAATPASEIPPPPAIVATAPTILPPSTGETVSTSRPFARPEETAPSEAAAAIPEGRVSLPEVTVTNNGTDAAAEHHDAVNTTASGESAHG
jgi:sec-independent protein translocase protein TatB